ncbi:MAG: hypothetical protein AB7F43_07400 [Bacteriovoracia bacterium]
MRSVKFTPFTNITLFSSNNFFYLTFLLFIATLPLCSSVFAKNLSSRLGFGFVDQYHTPLYTSLPAVSAKYGLTKDFHVSAFLGIDTSSSSRTNIGAKIYHNIFSETNLNFYGALGAAYLKETYSSIGMLAVLGAEFFIPGLDSLGLSFEAGLLLSNLSGGYVLSTAGYSFLNAGMHFYF